jgi:hypothetical protein
VESRTPYEIFRRATINHTTEPITNGYFRNGVPKNVGDTEEASNGNEGTEHSTGIATPSPQSAARVRRSAARMIRTLDARGKLAEAERKRSASKLACPRVLNTVKYRLQKMSKR